MKKTALLFFLLLFLIELFYLDFRYIDQIELVNGYVISHEEISFTKYELSFDDVHLDSLHFLDYFKDIEIISITIEIPELLEKKLIPVVYYFDTSSNQNNIKRITNEYFSILKKYNFIKEYYLKQYEGISIKKVTVQMLETDLQEWREKYPKVKIELAR